MIDPLLDTILEVMGDTEMGLLQIVKVVSGTRSTMGFFDDGSEILADGSSRQVEVTDRVVRIREGSLSVLVPDATVTCETAEADADGVVTRVATDYRVRRVLNDRGQAGVWLLILAPA